MYIRETETLNTIILQLLSNTKASFFMQNVEEQTPVLLDKEYLLDLFSSGLPSTITIYEILKLNSKDNNDLVLDVLLKSIMRRFLCIFDSLHDGVLIADKNEVIRYVNKSFERITGAKFSTLVGKTLSKARPGARLGTVISSEKAILGAHRVFGSTEYITDMHPIFVDNKCVGGITIARNISDIQDLQTKLNKYETKYNNLLRKVNKENTATYKLKDIISHSYEMKSLKDLSSKLAMANIPVLIRGESGTGKELFAHAIHNKSNKTNAPFVIVNCASIPNTLLESELFGYEEGAFSGAKKGGKKGLIHLADKGTLFLDEIGDMYL